MQSENNASRRKSLTNSLASLNSELDSLTGRSSGADDFIQDRLIEPFVRRNSLAFDQMFSLNGEASEESDAISLESCERAFNFISNENTKTQESSVIQPFQILRRLSLAATRGILNLMTGKADGPDDKKEEFNEKINEILEDTEEMKKIQEFMRIQAIATNSAAQELLPMYVHSYTLKAYRNKYETSCMDVIVDFDPDRRFKRCLAEKIKSKDIRCNTKYGVTA